jgi:hypothetical protein
LSDGCDGYVGRSVVFILGFTLKDVLARGAQSPNTIKHAASISAIMIPILGIFEIQLHSTIDDNVIRFWDDGNMTLPIIGWEGHDEGETSPNDDTSAHSVTGKLTRITTEKAAKYIGMDESDLTPETCARYTKKHGTKHTLAVMVVVVLVV